MLRALRFRQWAHFLVLPLGSAGPIAAPASTFPALARGVAIAFATLAFGYLVNALSDREMDASAEKNPLISSPPAAGRVVVVLAALALAALALAARAPRPVLVATLVILSSGLVYSVGPRLKRLPLVGTLMNATNFAPLLWMGLAGEAPVPGLWLLTLVFSGLVLQNQVLHEAADRAEDARGGIRTTARVLGVRGAALSIGLFGSLSVALVATTPGLAWLALVLVPPFAIAFPLVALRHGARDGWMRRARRAHRVCAIVAGAVVFLTVRASVG